MLALDPGLNHPAAALFRGGILVSAERVKVGTGLTDLPTAERCVRVAAAVVRWGMGLNMNPRWLVVEWPQIYRASKSKGDPNDLTPLAGIGSALAGMLSVALSPRDIYLGVLSPTPAEWAGQVPKSEKGDPWKSPRGARVRSRLSEAEVTAVLPSHDAVDAVGLGLWALGRFEPKRVYDFGSNEG
jgi:hypothetical protein